MTSAKTKVLIYSDGACSPNPGVGGWGVVLLSPTHNHRKELSGAEGQTTNNRMELTAAIKGLEQLKYPCEVDLYTDSTYVQHAFTKGWLERWQQKGWKTSQNKPVENQDLWKRLMALARLHKVQWYWVKGHDTNTENNRCDELAVQARQSFKA